LKTAKNDLRVPEKTTEADPFKAPKPMMVQAAKPTPSENPKPVEVATSVAVTPPPQSKLMTQSDTDQPLGYDSERGQQMAEMVFTGSDKYIAPEQSYANTSEINQSLAKIVREVKQEQGEEVPNLYKT